MDTQTSPEEQSASVLQVGRAPQSKYAALSTQTFCPATVLTPTQAGSFEQQIAICPMSPSLQHDSSAVQHESPQICVSGGQPEVKQLRQLPRQSHGWFSRWRRRSRLLTQRVRAFAKSQSPVAVLGTWQMRTHSSSASAREGISAAMALPAMSLSARRRLSEPSATARASSSKEWLVVCWLTCCPLSPKGGTRGLAPPS